MPQQSLPYRPRIFSGYFHGQDCFSDGPHRNRRDQKRFDPGHDSGGPASRHGYLLLSARRPDDFDALIKSLTKASI